jgi:hypothetical protein
MRRLRIVKKTPVVLGVCERCGSEFGTRLSGQDAVAEILMAFNAHKCIPLDSSQNALRVVREATENKKPTPPASIIARTGGDENMDDAKMEELRLIHRDLATYLKRQHEATNNSILAVAAIRGALASNPDLQKAYKASLRDLTKDGTFQANQDHENTLQNLLKRLAEW